MKHPDLSREEIQSRLQETEKRLSQTHEELNYL
jgi:hypothetical protein